MNIPLTPGKHKYIGTIRHKNSYYNFLPLAVNLNNFWYELDTYDRANLLPDSKHEDINLAIEYRFQNLINDYLVEDGLMLFEYDFDQLEPNYNNYGQRNDTGYKVNLGDVISSKELRKISADGIYRVITKDSYDTPFSPSQKVPIHEPGFMADNDDEYVLIDDGKEFFAGPIPVESATSPMDNNQIYASPVRILKNHILTGYKENDVKLLHLQFSIYRDDVKEWTVAICEQTKKTNKDYISDATLYADFLNAIQSNLIDDDKINLKVLSESLTSDMDLDFLDIQDKEIKETRKRKIKDYIDNKLQLSNIIDLGTNKITDIILSNKDSQNVKDLLSEMIETENFIDNFQSARIVQEQIEALKSQKEQLNDSVDELRKEEQELQKSNAHLSDAKITKATEEADSSLSKTLESLEKARIELQNIEQKTEKLSNLKEITDKIEEKRKLRQSIEADIQYSMNQFDKFLLDKDSQITSLALSGYISSKMLNAAANWEAKANEENYSNLITNLNSLPLSSLQNSDLIDYLCRMIQKKRPGYTRNRIINFFICLTQGFLTVFSGEPGCGKTSICNIIGKVLGSKDISQNIDCKDSDELNRFLSISVERGWTSKRDLIGYYNPLSKTFDKSNKALYHGLKILDTEQLKGTSTLPYIVLLDEANLSPMEYYWAEFMNNCDNIDAESSINLGEDYVLRIPETLRFLCTINNDHTTETLSPRLVDRAWIIQLPKTKGYVPEEDIDDAEIEIIPWNALTETFKCNGELTLSTSIQSIYSKLEGYFKQLGITISPRSDNAIRKYCKVASSLFVSEKNTDPSVIAIDYAFAQKILPKVCGSGDNYRKVLNELLEYCEITNLNIMSESLNQIILKGDNQMKYYQFF